MRSTVSRAAVASSPLPLPQILSFGASPSTTTTMPLSLGPAVSASSPSSSAYVMGGFQHHAGFSFLRASHSCCSGSPLIVSDMFEFTRDNHYQQQHSQPQPHYEEFMFEEYFEEAVKIRIPMSLTEEEVFDWKLEDGMTASFMSYAEHQQKPLRGKGSSQNASDSNNKATVGVSSINNNNRSSPIPIPKRAHY
eukprot:TRINITY_DN19147_c0_g1_i1.p1 TRINITY_DN19147_c0_g1~~TRINITY_DN19147_c0_g1_i1.p1  ORF type:complete len:193 (+),score=39.47 TRINITY_DN19147_c0_g1_i1:98-676(+)